MFSWESMTRGDRHRRAGGVHRPISVITHLLCSWKATARFRSRVYLFQFEQLESERLDLRKDAEQCRLVFQRAGEYRLAVVQPGHHRGKGGQGGSSEPSVYPNRV
jgi:hypothetical protein